MKIFIIIALILLQFQFFYQVLFAKDNTCIAFIADTQKPIVYEYLSGGDEKNLKATDLLFKDISILKPDALFIVGDLVDFGYMDYSWKNIDSNLKILKIKNMSYYAVPGNHEYFLYPDLGIANFKNRFKNSPITGFHVIIDSLAVIMLNSNFSELSEEEKLNQLDWFHKSIDSLEKSPSVKAIIVCCHHSPYTNSFAVEPAKEVQEDFLSAFEKSSKAKLFISGHSHNLELFEKNNKAYLVIGGGGGPGQKLNNKNINLPEPIRIDNRPRFFYTLISHNNYELIITTRCLSKDFSYFYEIELLKIKL